MIKNRKTTLEQRIAKLEKMILCKRSSSKRNQKFESMLSPIGTKFVYIIHSTMTDNNFYFISNDKSKLKSLTNEIIDLFLESVHSGDDFERAEGVFDQLMDLCNENNIQYTDDMDESPLMTYAEYLDSIGIDPDEDEYDKSVYLDEVIIVDDNDNPYKLKTIGRYSDRF
jgi:hypothetical protein